MASDKAIAAAIQRVLGRMDPSALAGVYGGGSSTYGGGGGVGIGGMGGGIVYPGYPSVGTGVDPETQRSPTPTEVTKLKERVAALEDMNTRISAELERLGNELAKVTGTLNNALSNAKRGGVGYWEEC
jgi:hypothetical protein